VLSAVSVAVTALADVTFSEAGTLQVTGLVAPKGPVTAQLRETVPVNPFNAVMLTVEVFPVVAPWRIEMLPLLLRANPGVTLPPAATAAIMPTVWTYFPVELDPVTETL
jgi:hypothetical protein